jgi:hypothetical protein
MAAVVEVWESNVMGRISVNVPGPRDTTKKLSVLGKGQRIRIQPEHRELAEEGIRDQQNNPFANGKLSQVGGPERVAPQRDDDFTSDQRFSDEDLAIFFSLSPDDFGTALRELSEANVRRLETLFKDKGGTVAQQEVIREYIEERWPVTSGDTASYREMRQSPQGAAL